MNTRKCYKFINRTVSWSEAREECALMSDVDDADLTSVPDQAVNDFLTTLSTDPAWIGGLKVDNTWTWSDGSEWKYQNGYSEGISEDGVFVGFNIGKVGFWKDISEPRENMGFMCQGTA